MGDFIPSGFGTQRSFEDGGVGARANASTQPYPSLLSGGGRDAVVAEWSSLYGCSSSGNTNNQNSSSGSVRKTALPLHRGAGAGVSRMSPIFYFTAHDATILSMEHNNHCKLLALSTTKNDIVVTWTQLMPLIESFGDYCHDEDDLFGLQGAPVMDKRLLEWDPATMSILIDQLTHPCTQLTWAPWQHGIVLVGLCLGHALRLYRYSHGRWALEGRIAAGECNSFAVSTHFTIACACNRGRVQLWTRNVSTTATAASRDAVGSSWMICDSFTISTDDGDDGGGGRASGSSGLLHKVGEARGGAAATGATATTTTTATADRASAHRRRSTAGRHRPKDILSVDWDESGSLLGIGDQEGVVRVLSVGADGTKLSQVVYQHPLRSFGSCQQVAWAPSSGRSFLILAAVFPSRILLFFFRRLRLMNAAGLPHGAYANRRASPATLTSASSMELLTVAQAPCEEVAKLSWNNTGTRFATAGLDSAVSTWAVDIRYQYQSLQTATAVTTAAAAAAAATAAAGGLDMVSLGSVLSIADGSSGAGGAERLGLAAAATTATPVGAATAATTAAAGRSGAGSVSGGGGGGTATGGGGGLVDHDKRLILVASIRRVTAVHPYHALA